MKGLRSCRQTTQDHSVESKTKDQKDQKDLDKTENRFGKNQFVSTASLVQPGIMYSHPIRNTVQNKEITPCVTLGTRSTTETMTTGATGSGPPRDYRRTLDARASSPRLRTRNTAQSHHQHSGETRYEHEHRNQSTYTSGPTGQGDSSKWPRDHHSSRLNRPSGTRRSSSVNDTDQCGHHRLGRSQEQRTHRVYSIQARNGFHDRRLQRRRSDDHDLVGHKRPRPRSRSSSRQRVEANPLLARLHRPATAFELITCPTHQRQAVKLSTS